MKKADKAMALAKEIIKENQYVSLGTAGATGVPWVAPVVYAYDKKYSLYFMSQPNSRHIRDILQNSAVSGAIFDSQQLFGAGRGVQFEGKVTEIPKAKLAQVFKLYFDRKWPFGNLVNIRDFKRFFKLFKYRFYKIEPTNVWVTDVSKDYDARTSVHLNV